MTVGGSEGPPVSLDLLAHPRNNRHIRRSRLACDFLCQADSDRIDLVVPLNRPPDIIQLSDY